MGARGAYVRQGVGANLVQSERRRHLDCLTTDLNRLVGSVPEHVKTRYLAQDARLRRR